MFNYYELLSKLLDTNIGNTFILILLILVIGLFFYLLNGILGGLKTSIKFWPITLTILLNTLYYIKPSFENLPRIYISLAISLLILWLSVFLYKIKIANKGTILMAMVVNGVTLYCYYLNQASYFMLALLLSGLNIFFAFRFLITSSHLYEKMSTVAHSISEKTRKLNTMNKDNISLP